MTSARLRTPACQVTLSPSPLQPRRYPARVSAFTTSVILEGRLIPSQTPVRLHAGPLTMLLEPASGFLRQIKRGNAPVLNGIYAAVRDRNWGTVDPLIHNLRIDQRPDSFSVAFTSVHQRDEIHFEWEGSITGTSDGTIRYAFDGGAKSDFPRNRIGFCVLHDATCAGMPCIVDHVDGSQTESTFPLFIAPHQPFRQIQAITQWLDHTGGGCKSDSSPRERGQSLLTSAPAVEVEVRMAGEVFEMEDQRNWTDATFKTYCTPLDLPFPVKVRKGEKFRQSVEVRCHAEGRRSCRPTALTGSLGGARGALPSGEGFHPLPRLGLSIASHELPMNDREVELLKRLQLDHLRCDLMPLAVGWEMRWQEAVRQARALDTRLHLALHLDHRAQEQLAATAGLVHTELVDAWLIFRRDEKATAPRWIDLARQLLSPLGGLVVGGTDAYFAELNRNRPAPGGADAINWSINPQVHAFDNLSLAETLDAQWATVRSARELFSGELMISPVTLQPRFNPNATTEPPPAPPDVLPSQVDVRQMSLFGAAWTLGSIASLSRAPLLRSITYYETTGWRGVMEWSAAPRLPHKFVTRPGWVFPMYFVFAWLAGYDEGRFVSEVDPLRQTALMLRRRHEPGLVRVLVASLDGDVSQFTPPVGFTPNRRWILDQDNAVPAMRDPARALSEGWSPVTTATRLSIPPFGLLVLEGSVQEPASL